MKIEYLLTAGVLYLLFAVIMFQISQKYRIKSVYVFLLSLFLTPLAGLIALLISEKGNLITIERYRCGRCGYEHTEDHKECPHCVKDGHHIPLKKVKFKSL
ncbi:MAG TPA: hypothetical protein VJ939_08170 [Bacteroidales bacterium]|nr:hypothetical protein [Bacteroidales bacterium]